MLLCADADAASADLASGTLACPSCATGRLRLWGRQSPPAGEPPTTGAGRGSPGTSGTGRAGAAAAWSRRSPG